MNIDRKKLKYEATIIAGQSPSSDSYNVNGDGLPFLQGCADFGETFPIQKYYSNEPKKISKYGDILISVRAPVGELNISNKEYAIGRGLAIVRGKRSRNKFLYYVLESEKGNLNSIATGSTFKAISREDLKNHEVIIPGIQYQILIERFLDCKTSQLNTLIADKERLIELLEEKRQAVITEAVTKGLDPDVPMKDSGVEWIGEIPEHWEKAKIKYTTYVKGRIGWQGLRSDEFMYEGPYLITGMHFKDDSVDWENCYHITKSRYYEAPEIQIKENDLLITKDGTIGKLAYIDHLPGKASLNSHLLVMRPLKNQYKNKFMYWYMKSSSFTNFVRINQSGTTFAGISQQSIENLKFPIPGLEEQSLIIDYLDEKINIINNSLDMIKNQIDKLKEYRQSLIYEAVTGKIDVQEMESEVHQEEVSSS